MCTPTPPSAGVPAVAPTNTEVEGFDLHVTTEDDAESEDDAVSDNTDSSSDADDLVTARNSVVTSDVDDEAKPNQPTSTPSDSFRILQVLADAAGTPCQVDKDHWEHPKSRKRPPHSLPGSLETSPEGANSADTPRRKSGRKRKKKKNQKSPTPAS